MSSCCSRRRCRYDGHKDAILRSGERHQAGSSTGFAGGQRPDDEVDLYAYFTSACFSGFGNGPRVRKFLNRQQGSP